MDESFLTRYIISIDPGERNFGISLVGIRETLPSYTSIFGPGSNLIHLADPDKIEPVHISATCVDLLEKNRKEAKRELGKNYSEYVLSRAWFYLMLFVESHQNKIYPCRSLVFLIEKTEFCKPLVYGLWGRLQGDPGCSRVHLIDPRSVSSWAKLPSGRLNRLLKKKLTPDFVKARLNFPIKSVLWSEHEWDSLLNTVYFLNKPHLFRNRWSNISLLNSLPTERQSSQDTLQEQSMLSDSSNTKEKDYSPPPTPSFSP